MVAATQKIKAHSISLQPKGTGIEVIVKDTILTWLLEKFRRIAEEHRADVAS